MRPLKLVTLPSSTYRRAKDGQTFEVPLDQILILEHIEWPGKHSSVSLSMKRVINFHFKNNKNRVTPLSTSRGPILGHPRIANSVDRSTLKISIRRLGHGGYRPVICTGGGRNSWVSMTIRSRQRRILIYKNKEDSTQGCPLAPKCLCIHVLVHIHAYTYMHTHIYQWILKYIFTH